MKRTVILIAIWVLLFAGTWVVRIAWDENGTQIKPVGSAASSQQLQSQLEKSPRKSFHVRELPAPLSTKLHDALMANLDPLRRCKQLVESKMSRPQEYFEVSFVLGATTQSNGPGVNIERVIVERATLTLTSDEERCIENALSTVALAADAPSTDRFTYQFCFSRS